MRSSCARRHIARQRTLTSSSPDHERRFCGRFHHGPAQVIGDLHYRRIMTRTASKGESTVCHTYVRSARLRGFSLFTGSWRSHAIGEVQRPIPHLPRERTPPRQRKSARAGQNARPGALCCAHTEDFPIFYFFPWPGASPRAQSQLLERGYAH